MPHIECHRKKCNNIKYKRPVEIERSKTGIFYCSRKCRKIDRNPIIQCNTCGIKFTRAISIINSYDKNYCSNDCKYKGNHFFEGTKECICYSCDKIFNRDVSRIKYNRTFCSKKCYKKSAKLYPNTYHLRVRIKNRDRGRKYIKDLCDPYIRSLIFGESNLLKEDIPEKHLIAKKLQLSLNRQSQQLNK